jgi:hypothetical protein
LDCCEKDDASPSEQAAVSLFRELSHLTELEVADTTRGSAWHLTIGDYDGPEWFLQSH